MAKVKNLEIASRSVAMDKASAQMVAIVAGAVFVTIFCLFASKAAFSSMRYNMKVASVQTAADNQLTANTANFATLQSNYKKFDKSTTNIIGGSAQKDGAGPNDGPNSQIVLDALPLSYDFPRVATSVEKILRDRNLSITSISGTDDELNQQDNAASTAPVAVDMPFTFEISQANYESATELVTTLQNSIRPIKINTMNITGGGNKMSVKVSAETYYQPPKLLKNDTQVIQ